MSRRITPHLVISPNGFGFRTDTGAIFRLNGTGCEVLHRLQEGEEELQIAQYLADHHDIPLHRARQDLTGFLEHLANLELLAS